jgi:hypothetical protein
MFRQSLLADGYTDNDIRSMRRTGAVHRLRPGVSVGADAWSALTPDGERRALITGTVPYLTEGAVVSHISAAVLHELPIIDDRSEIVHVTRQQKAGGFRRGHLHTHSSRLDDSAITMITGVRVTSVARTVVDCACTMSLEAGVSLADNALSRGLTSTGELEATLASVGRRRGIVRAAMVVELADAGGQSVGESLSRMIFLRLGLPAPSLQLKVYDGPSLIGQSDFAWPEFRTLGESDGKIKYGRLLKPGEQPGDVVWREKLREDALRRLGWEVVRWTWAELMNPALLDRRRRAAFELGLRYV